MGPGPKRKLSLPSSLLRELDEQQPPSSYTSGKGRPRHQLSRRDLRKAQRVQKKKSRTHHSQSRPVVATKPSAQPRQPEFAHRHFPKGVTVQEEDTFAADEGEDDGDEEDEDDGDLDPESGVDDEIDAQNVPASGQAKSAQKKLAQDDAEIADLERKLGLKGRKSLPKSFGEDGLGDLLDGLDDDDGADGEEPLSKRKRKAEADEWLAQKRQKAQAAVTTAQGSSDEGSDLEQEDSDLDDDGLDSAEGESGEDDDDVADFEGFSDTREVEPVRPQRENPYVAPTTGVAKYVPPSLRKQSQSNNEVEAQLRRRVQGLVNRLTNESMVGITKDCLALYDSNPRQTVTSTLVETALTLVCSPEKRPDSFFAMIAGFVAAAHRAMGMAVSAYFIQQVVEVFGKYYENASGDQSDAASKHLITLLAELYNMQVVGCNLVFDFVRLFLQDLSELNTELLLRIIQLCGPSLRREDPQALQDIVNRIKLASSKNMSVRTSFMIDEMKKLQSNKTKAVARNRDVADQRAQIKKRIGTLGGSQDIQPFRVGLKDIQNADKNGKWWLVGASWTGKKDDKNGDESDGLKTTDADDGDDRNDFDDDDLGIPDLWQLAREQGFNTEVRQRIFVALHAATDYENADLLIRKLRLNKHQRREIPEVIVRSGGRQQEYNHYYTLVASRFCGERELAFQFRRCLTTRFRKMGEDIDTGDNEDYDADEAEDFDMRWLYNAAKLYGGLVVMGSLKLEDVIKYRNLTSLQEKAHLFVEVMFLTVLQDTEQGSLKTIFGGLDKDLTKGVQYFIKKKIRKTDLLRDKKQKRQIQERCDRVYEILEASLAIDTLG